MPESIPLKKTPHSRPALHPEPNDADDASRAFSSPVLVSNLSSRHTSRNPSPFATPPDRPRSREGAEDPDFEFDDWDEHDAEMPSDLRPDFDRDDNRAASPLLGHGKNNEGTGPDPPPLSRRSTMHERDPETQARFETRRKYTYAAIFLALSLISFTVQTETAVYIQHELKWEKPYCMLYMTHGSWILLWPTQLLLLRLQNWSTPWPTFWRRHVQLLRQTSLMVQHQTLHPSTRQSQHSPVTHMAKTTAFVTCALTVAGGSWYLAVNMTTASDLTAIYNCSAFFAYVFSIPLLHERIRTSKVVAVAVAIVGVFIVAYGGPNPAKHGSKSGGGTGGKDAPPSEEAQSRVLGNTIIGIGSILYGLYEVLYKRLACPPEGCSPGRGMIFANTFGSMIGLFTVLVLWIPLPVLHYMGWEEFELPRGQQASMMAISVLANASTYISLSLPFPFPPFVCVANLNPAFSGSFLILISLTSPVLSSVAALLTIFIVAVVDQLLPPPLNHPLTSATVVGGLFIIGAFILLSWATYKEMDEERRKKLEESESDIDE